MLEIRKELARLKTQTSANDTATEALAAFVKQAMLLQELPASKRTLQSPEMTCLFVDHCGRLRLRKQPHRDEMRDYKTVSRIACQCLVAAVQKSLCSRHALNEDALPFLAKRLGTTSDAQHLVPRSVSQLHALLKDSGRRPLLHSLAQPRAALNSLHP